MATIKDIAAKTGLGLATISSYLNGGSLRPKNRKAIEDAIDELGFEVNEIARGLKTQQTKTVGVVIPELSNIFCTSVISEIEDILRTHGYATIVCDCRSNAELEQQSVKFLLQKRVDGIINIPTNPNGEHLAPALSKNKPILLIDRKIDSVPCDTVLVDNFSAAYDATLKLIQSGHREIGIITVQTDIYTAGQRLSGYKKALEDNSIHFNPKLSTCGRHTIEDGTVCMNELLKYKGITAVLAANYEMTVGAVIALNQNSIRIPEDLSFIGFDNLSFANAVNPTLTIVTQPTEKIGETAAQIMLERLGGDMSEKLQNVLLPTKLVHGKSVKKRNKT